MEVNLDKIKEIAESAKGEIDHIYLHWTAGHYGQYFDDYHINIDGDGSIQLMHEDLTDTIPHTWQRNSRAVGIALDCCVGACANGGVDTDFGDEPPTQEQIESLAKVVAALCDGLGLDINKDTVMTHCEAAELDDYGPSTTCERWDLWYLPDLPVTSELKPGGEVIRGKAAWWQKNI